MHEKTPDIPMRGKHSAIVETGSRASVVVRGDARDVRFVRTIADAVGLDLPIRPNTSAHHLLDAVLWLGPDEWLVVSETQPGQALASHIRQALQGLHAAVIDVSDARVVYAVTGAHARDVLAKGCSLDFHPRAFPLGRCARSLLAEVPVLIHHRSAEPCFELYVARSVGDYVRAWLHAAVREYLHASGRQPI